VAQNVGRCTGSACDCVYVYVCVCMRVRVYLCLCVCARASVCICQCVSVQGQCRGQKEEDAKKNREEREKNPRRDSKSKTNKIARGKSGVIQHYNCRRERGDANKSAGVGGWGGRAKKKRESANTHIRSKSD